MLAFDRGIRVRAAERVLEIPEGLVVRHDGLPNLYHLNAVLCDRGVADPPAVIRIADAHLGDLGHRHVVFDDAELAERLAPELLAAGWGRQRIVFMRWANEPEAKPRAATARPIDDEAARALQLALLSEEAPRNAPDGTVASALAGLLVAGQEAVRAGTRSVVFAAAARGGELASMGTLFLHDGSAMIDEVGTFEGPPWSRPRPGGGHRRARPGPRGGRRPDRRAGRRRRLAAADVRQPRFRAAR